RQGGSSQVMQFGQVKAKTYGRENKVKTGFDDVAGHEEAKQELKEVVDFEAPQKYIRIGAKSLRGCCSSARPERVRRCSRARSPARRAFRF
ncbi:MAG: hypothetical protein U5L04_01830, partial [Trueperaceae bacterium]|nr:hypothetical protein [Trueperaceae bacterium]